MLEKTKSLVVSLAIAALVGCSSSSTGGGGTTPATVDAACGNYADTICAKFESCSPLLVKVTYGDLATCKARSKIACMASLNAPSTGATLDKAAPCIAAFSNVACADLFSGAQPAACEFVGPFAEGTPCGDGGQCASGVCGRTVTGQCGTCLKKNAVGDACTGSCNNDLACVGGKCAANAKAGEACGTSTTAPCGGGLVCTMGKCAAPAKEGDACSSDGSTAPTCDTQAGLLCDGTAKKCRLVTIAAAGAACGYDTTTMSYTACGGGANCQLASGSSKGTCVAPAADGAACDDSKSLHCLSPAKCIAAKCVLPDYSTCK